MAETQSVRVDEKQLKYLGFVQEAAIYVILLVTSFYEYAKSNSGPLKSGILTVEGAVTAVIGPVYHKFHHVPFQLLLFVDRKVDQLMTKVDHHMPALIKDTSSQVRVLVTEIKQVGVVETAKKRAHTVYIKYQPVANEYYCKYEPLAEKYIVVTWSSLNRLPLFPQLAHVLVPTTAYCATRYNRTVVYFRSRSYTVSYYAPLVPIEKIAKIFKTTENGHAARNGYAADGKTQ
ncbi:hypothetical protein ACET3Z_002573 [Daucus carota]